MTLVRLLWRAAATRLKPLRLPRAQMSCKQTTQPLPTKESAELYSREGRRRVYSFWAPLRERGPCEVSLHLQSNPVEEGNGWYPIGLWRVDELNLGPVEFFVAWRCWQNLWSERRSGQRIGMSVIWPMLGTFSDHLSTPKTARTRWSTLPLSLMTTESMNPWTISLQALLLSW